MRKLVRCRYCGEEIELIRTTNSKTIPCQPTAVRFTPAGGPDTFVADGGRVVRGVLDRNGTEVGNPKHARYCRIKTESGRL